MRCGAAWEGAVGGLVARDRGKEGAVPHLAARTSDSMTDCLGLDAPRFSSMSSVQRFRKAGRLLRPLINRLSDRSSAFELHLSFPGAFPPEIQTAIQLGGVVS
jgi:hypothetical protein